MQKLVNQRYDTTIILAGLVGDPITKKYKSLDRKYLEDSLMTSIAGISAAMKNTG